MVDSPMRAGRGCIEEVRKMDVNELNRVCMPALEFMKKNFTPHDTLIITDAQFKIVSDTVCIPINEYGTSGNDLSSADEQTSLLTKRSGIH